MYVSNDNCFKGVEFMERFLRKSLSIALLIGASVMYAGQAPRDPNKRPVTTSLKPRPQSLNGARKVSGEAPGDGITHLPDLDTLNGNFWVAFEYQRTFQPNALARTLFGDFVVNAPATTQAATTDCKNPCGATLLVQGGDVNNFHPDANAIRAENLYLPTDFNSTLTLKPSISTFIVDFNGRIGFDNWAQGLYLRVYAPFVHTRWNMNMTENIINKGTSGGAPNVALTAASDYFAGKAPSYAGAPVSIKANPLNYHRINTAATGTTTDTECANPCGAETINGFGEVRGELGWDFVRSCDYHLGLYLAGAAPTGTKPTAKLLFSPLVGNGKHWELGGGLTAHWVFWRNESEENHAGIYLDAMVTHLFKAREQRVFDLKGHTLSRYQLAAKMDAPAEFDLAGASINSVGNPPAGPFESAKVQFNKEFTPIANLTAQDINVSIAAQVDLTAWVNFTAGGFTWDIGYNLFLQTCEKFDCVAKCGPVLATDKNKWVIMGRSNPFGLGTLDATNLGTLFNLAFSDSKATLNHGTLTNNDINEGIDNSALFATNTAIGAAAGKQFLVGPRTSQTLPADAIHLSNPPIFIQLEDIDMQKGSQKLTNKVWTYLGYTFDREGVVPFIGVGGEAEFARTPSCKPECPPVTTTKDCGTCTDTGISQWGVWAKVGVLFD